MGFMLRRAIAGDADEIANVYSASFRLRTFLAMLHTTDEYRQLVPDVAAVDDLSVHLAPLHCHSGISRGQF